MSNFTQSISPICSLLTSDFDPTNITNLPDSVDPTWTVLAVVIGVASPVTAGLNLSVIWAVLADENLRSVKYNILQVAIAFTDLFCGLVSQPLFCWHLTCLVLRCSSSCRFMISALASLSGASYNLLAYAVSTVERYLAIQHSQFYLEKVTLKKVILMTVFLWAVIPTAMLSIRFLLNDSEKYQKVPVAGCALIIIAIILYCCIRVQLTAHFQSKAINAQAATVQEQQEQQEQHRRRLREYKHFATTMVLLFTTLLCYFPLIVVSIIQAVKGRNFTSDSRYLAHPVAATLAHFQSIVNPIIISLRMSCIRKAVKKRLMSLLTVFF